MALMQSDIVLADGAICQVESDETVNNAIVNSGGTMYVSSGGTTDNTTVNSGGRLSVSSGGTATGIRENGGYVLVEDGAVVTFVSNTFSGIDIPYRQSVTVHSGTTACGTIVGSHTMLDVFNGGIANNTTVDDHGTLAISSGGIANSTNLCCTEDYGGAVGPASWSVSMNVFSGGIASNTVIDYGRLTVFSGGTANQTSGHQLALVDVSSGGTVNDIIVDDGCALTVSSGGTALSIKENGGLVRVADGANVTFVSNTFSGRMLWGTDDMAIHSGTTAVETTISRISLHVSSGGQAKQTVILAGKLFVSDGGMVESTLIDSGSMCVCSGGTANDTMINGYGRLSVSSGGTATIIFNPWQGQISSDTGAEITFLERDANVYYGNSTTGVVSKANVIDSLSIASGHHTIIYSGGTVTNTAINRGGSMYVDSGGAANETTVNSRGTIKISSGGTANNTTINRGGSMYIASGGTASGVDIYSGAYLSMTYGAALDAPIINSGVSLSFVKGISATNIVENGGFVEVSKAAKVTFASNTFSGIILEGAQATVHSGTTALDTEVGSLGYLFVFSDGTANETTVEKNGLFVVSEGGMANSTTIELGGRMDVYNGAANSTAVNSAGVLSLCEGKTSNTNVNIGGSMFVFSGGTADQTIVDRGTVFVCGGVANDTVIKEQESHAFGGILNITSGGTTNNAIVNSLGKISVLSGTANNTTINSGGGLIVDYGGTANNIMVNSGGILQGSGGILNNFTICSGGSMSFDGMLTGKMVFEDGAVVGSRQMVFVNFDLTQTSAGDVALINNLSVFSKIESEGFVRYTLMIDPDLNAGSYTYVLANGAEKFNPEYHHIYIVNTLGKISYSVSDPSPSLTIGETLAFGDAEYTLNVADSVLSLTVFVPGLSPINPVGTSEKVSWETSTTDEDHQFIVEYSTDNFEHVIQVVTNGNGIDTPDMPAGTYQWRVKADANSDWAVGEAITVEPEADAAPKVVQAVEDGNDDLFFATTNGTWSRFYYAQHVGSINDWNGTNELLSASGRGRIQNLFFGTADPNVLCLTDGENGDALFVDDAYTGLPEEVEANTARLYKIREIRAGAGDDIVDMTSQDFEYIGDGLTIRGGEGNDTIWANKGDNWLFGDDGNDRIVGASGNDVIVGGIGNDSMHGGGGNDVFTFCDNWGADMVEQLETGSVTLWFASGDESNWNAETLTYTDGENSVTVSGVTAEQIMLKFGSGDTPEDAAQFAALSGIGAFDAFTSQRIFEESGTGILA